jgi:pre-mRNA-processing factor 17
MFPQTELNSNPRNPKFGSKNGVGTLEETSVESYSFDEQYKNYQRSGYAVDSTTNEIIGDLEAYNNEKLFLVNKKNDKKRKAFEQDVANSLILRDDSVGPWAETIVYSKQLLSTVSEIDQVVNDVQFDDKLMPKSSDSNVFVLEPDAEEEKWEKVNERKQSFILPPRPERGSQILEAKSTFHGSAQFDYQGRSWLTCPSRLKSDDGDHECYIPKKCTKKLTGHTKGVQAIEFFPNTGHMLLSASMDGKCKLWDTHSDFNVKRTYSGHSEAVRSIHMSNTGEQFLSSGFDRCIRLWDVETGQATGTFTNRKMAYSVKFYPRDNNIFIAACSDNKLYQWDSRTGQVCQEYNYHLQPCNSILFVDDGRKFVSTSDDKKVLVWEFDIPVPIKYIAEPDMHCIPSLSMHPSQAFFAGQSMDNKIVVFACGEKVKPLKKKVFTGHNNSGYACQVGFSPNGKFIISGDGHGQVHFWDWKTTKSYRRFQAHDNGPCMGAVWHPLNPSTVATCGWDGLIKIWE